MEHNFPARVSKEEINKLPLGQYEGPIVLITKPEAVERHMAEIMAQPIVGFDTEAKPSFKKGESHPVSLIQIATPQKVYILRINYCGMHPLLLDFLANPHVVKAGIALKDDVRDLRKLAHFAPAGMLELDRVAREQLKIISSGLRALAAMFMEVRISKSQQTSNWENEVLTDAQLTYAATDAWVCLKVHQKLTHLGFL